MKIKSCLYYLGLSCFPVSIMALINIFYSFYFSYLDNLGSYILVLAISLLIGLVFFKLGKKERDNINIYEQLLLIFLVYFLISFLFHCLFIIVVMKFPFLIHTLNQFLG